MENYKFFSNRQCEFFPCHKGVPEEEFNCMFCYCPLYYAKCGGNGKILPNGIKDCTDCILPHKKDSYGYITGRICEINEMTEDKNGNI